MIYKLLKPIFICLFVITISYGNQLSPYYIKYLFNDPVEIISKYSIVESTCESSADSNCKKKLKINLSNNKELTHLGIGPIVPAGVAFCNSKEISKLGNPDNPGNSAYEMLTTYNSINLKANNCINAIDINIFSPPEFRRNGLIAETFVLSNEQGVFRIKKLIEFFLRDIKLILTLTLVLMLIVTALFNVFKSKDSDHRLTFVPELPFWVGYLLITSGILQILFPIISSSLMFTRLANYFALYAKIFPTLRALEEKHGIAKWLKTPFFQSVNIFKTVNPISFFLILIVSSPFFALTLAPIVFVFGFVTILIAIKNKNIWFGIYGLSHLVDSGGLFQIPFLPTISVTNLYVAVFTIFQVKSEFTSGVSLTRSLQWARENILENTKDNPTELMKSFSSQLNIRRASLLVLSKSGELELYTLNKERPDSDFEITHKHLDHLPAVFAHVFSTQESLWHVDVASQFHSNIKKGESSKWQYEGDIYTALPIVSDERFVGGIALTNYCSKNDLTEGFQLEFRTLVTLLIPSLSSAIKRTESTRASEWNETISKLCSSLDNGNKVTNLDSITDLVHQKLKQKTMIFQLDTTNRKVLVKSLAGFNDLARNAYLNSTAYAVSQNEQGPLPLAINKEKTITVPDVTLLSKVLHSSTLSIFHYSETKSLAVTPIFAQNIGSDGAMLNKEVWGALWFESSEVGSFTSAHTDGFKLLADTIGQFITQSNLKAYSTQVATALAGFVPKHVQAALVSGNSTEEKDFGTLFMADIRQSTKISRFVGGETWLNFVSKITPTAIEIGKHYGFTLQSVVWDAFYYTRSEVDGKSLTTTNEILSFCTELNELFVSELTQHFGKVKELTISSTIGGRFCCVRGDNSRGIKFGLNQSWTITGVAMASVSKLEQVCKGLDGWIFVSESILGSGLNLSWSKAESKIPGTEEDFYIYSKRPDVIKTKEAA